MSFRVGSKPLGGCGSALFLMLALIVACFTLMAGAYLTEDRTVFGVWDVMLGLLFAVWVLLLGVGRWRKSTYFALGAAVWILVTSWFLLWHEVEMRIRLAASARSRALYQVVRTEVELLHYRIHCYGIPPAEKGLSALCTNPGVAGWQGPYLSEDCLVDPWGHRLQYRVEGDRIVVWSNGPDGLSGTKDDIYAGLVK